MFVYVFKMHLNAKRSRSPSAKNSVTYAEILGEFLAEHFFDLLNVGLVLEFLPELGIAQECGHDTGDNLENNKTNKSVNMISEAARLCLPLARV